MAQGGLPCNAEAVNDRAKLIMHRLIARHLARSELSLDSLYKSFAGSPDAVEWQSILQKDRLSIRRLITRRGPELNRLRLTSPLMSVLDLRDPDLRKRIWKKARLGVASF